MQLHRRQSSFAQLKWRLENLAVFPTRNKTRIRISNVTGPKLQSWIQTITWTHAVTKDSRPSCRNHGDVNDSTCADTSRLLATCPFPWTTAYQPVRNAATISSHLSKFETAPPSKIFTHTMRFSHSQTNRPTQSTVTWKGINFFSGTDHRVLRHTLLSMWDEMFFGEESILMM